DAGLRTRRVTPVGPVDPVPPRHVRHALRAGERFSVERVREDERPAEGIRIGPVARSLDEGGETGIDHGEAIYAERLDAQFAAFFPVSLDNHMARAAIASPAIQPDDVGIVAAGAGGDDAGLRPDGNP